MELYIFTFLVCKLAIKNKRKAHYNGDLPFFDFFSMGKIIP